MVLIEFFDFEFKKKGIYYPSLPSIYTDGFAPSPNDKFNVNNNFLAVIIFKIRKFIKKLFQ